ncbi:MAG: hypothetical protein COA88_14180 [Kordia sp.]|nr:MAG: hypothetical protein COA88_14180 [Kordia sp.]
MKIKLIILLMVAICFSCSTDDSVYLDVNQENDSSFLNRAPIGVCEGGYTPGDEVIIDYEIKIKYARNLPAFKKAVIRFHYSQSYPSLTITSASKRTYYDELWNYQILWFVDDNGCLIGGFPEGIQNEVSGDDDLDIML